jgi:hypothetical protein
LFTTIEIEVIVVLHFLNLIVRIREDLQGESAKGLIVSRGEPSLGLLHLVLFGRASPYLHNGSMDIKDKDGEVLNLLKQLL